MNKKFGIIAALIAFMTVAFTASSQAADQDLSFGIGFGYLFNNKGLSTNTVKFTAGSGHGEIGLHRMWNKDMNHWMASSSYVATTNRSDNGFSGAGKLGLTYRFDNKMIGNYTALGYRYGNAVSEAEISVDRFGGWKKDTGHYFVDYSLYGKPRL